MSECMPEWAKKLEDWGKKVEQKFEGFEKPEKEKPKRKPWEKKGEFVWGILGNLFALYLVNNAQGWFPGFFTGGFTAVLWVLNVSILAQIIGNAILLLFSPRIFYWLLHSLMNAVSVVSMIVIISLFPFNIPYGLAQIVRFGFGVIIFIVAVTTFFELLKIFEPEG